MDRLLEIYMNDELAQGVAWRELARRSQKKNQGSDLGEALRVVAEAIAEDVETFEKMMQSLGLKRSRIKIGVALVAERAGRLKLNGRLFSYSPLSRFLELEILVMGIDRKKQMWETLADLARLRDRLPDTNFDELIRRAEEQKGRLQPFRETAGKAVFERQ